MKPPIFIQCADGEVLAYELPDRALRYAESADVESGEYVAVFDADGRKFRLDVVEPTRRKKGWLGLGTSIELTPVKFTSLEDMPTGADELRVILVKLLPDADADASLSELVHLAVKRFRSP